MITRFVAAMRPAPCPIPRPKNVASREVGIPGALSLLSNYHILQKKSYCILLHLNYRLILFCQYDGDKLSSNFAFICSLWPTAF